MLSSQKPTRQVQVQGFLAAFTYCIVSTLLSVLNKFVLSSESQQVVNLLICSQQAFIVIFLVIGNFLGIVELKPTRFWKQSSFWSVFLTFTAYVVTSLHGLRYINLPLYTALRKTAICFTVISEWLFLTGVYPSGSTWLAVFIILVGVLVSGYNDLQFDFIGYSLCFVCNMATCAYIIALARHKRTSDVDTANLLLQCGLLAAPLFLLISLVSGELRSFFAPFNGMESGFAWAFMVSSIFAGLLNMAAMVNTRLNSPTTQSICANLKDVLVVSVASMVQPVELNFEAKCGLLLTLIGACIHSFRTTSAYLLSLRRKLVRGSRRLTFAACFVSLMLLRSGFSPKYGLSAQKSDQLVHLLHRPQ